MWEKRNEKELPKVCIIEMEISLKKYISGTTPIIYDYGFYKLGITRRY